MAKNRKTIMPHTNLNTPNFYTLNKNDIFNNIKDRVKSKAAGATVIVPHVCNNIDVFGGGFAAAVSNEFPIVKENFHLLGKKAKLGQTQFVSAFKDKEYGHEIIFANMIAQNGLRNHKNTRPLNYAALVYAMSNVKLYMTDYKKTHDNANIEIHCPKFGSGLAGGDWKFISELIKDVWYPTNKNIFVYIL
jgi:hypothetical protein